MSRAKSTEQFVTEAQGVWDNRWDYSNTTYVKALEALTITCPEHGDFKQIPVNHLRGSVGCGECSGRKTLTTEEFTALAKKVHGDAYDYTKTEYVDNHTKVTITCKLHGDFQQHPRSHRKGSVGCPLCNGWVHTPESFTELSQAQFGNKFTYHNTSYTKAREKVTITCREHGDFIQVADSHLRGFIGCLGCQSTGFSAGERELGEFIQSLGVAYEANCRGKISPLKSELDIYIKEQNLAIEFNGLYYHSEKFRALRYHADKFKAAQVEGIKLLQVWEDDWYLKRSIVEEHIRQALGVSSLPKIAARKTEITTITIGEARQFLDAHHIQGFVGASHYLGLRFKGTIVALSCFKSKGDDYELVRYATSANVQGGHSKLVTYFERNHSYRNLLTFADLTFGDGGLYRKTGWVEDTYLRPDYFYVKGTVRYHKFNYRIKRFREDPTLKFEEGMTERELAQLNGFLRVYDAGKIRFIKPHP